MGLIIADCSVAISWLHAGQATTETESLLERIGADLTIMVPPLWFYEVTNALLLLVKREKILMEDGFGHLNDLRKLRYQVDHGLSEPRLAPLLKLAADQGLSAYDASYLELALRWNVPLATRDEPLRKAAIKCGVELCF
jgi:predicted nucleic acid-binding protein